MNALYTIDNDKIYCTSLLLLYDKEYGITYITITVHERFSVLVNLLVNLKKVIIIGLHP